jgi:hypothetical protein
MKNIILISLTALILVGCAAKKDFINLPPDVMPKITATQAYLVEPSKSINTEIKVSQISSYTGGGLIFALMDCAIMESRKYDANEVMKTLQKDFDSYNLRAKLKEKIQNSIIQNQWLHSHSLDDLKEFNTAEIQKNIKNSKTDYVLVSQFVYSMCPQFQRLAGTLFVTLYAPGDLETPIFKFNITHLAILHGAKATPEENAKLWVENNGLNLNTAFDKIIDQIIVKLNICLGNPGTVE